MRIAMIYDIGKNYTTSFPPACFVTLPIKMQANSIKYLSFIKKITQIWCLSLKFTKTDIKCGYDIQSILNKDHNNYWYW